MIACLNLHTDIRGDGSVNNGWKYVWRGKIYIHIEEGEINTKTGCIITIICCNYSIDLWKVRHNLLKQRFNPKTFERNKGITFYLFIFIRMILLI